MDLYDTLLQVYGPPMHFTLSYILLDDGDRIWGGGAHNMYIAGTLFV